MGKIKTNNKFLLLKSAYLKNKLINAGIYMLGLIIILVSNYFAVLNFKASIWIWLDLILMVFAVSPIFFFKGTLFDRIYLPIMMFFVTLLITINVNYYKFFNSVFPLKDLPLAFNNMTQVGTHASELNWLMIGINIALFLIFTASILIFNIRFNFKDDVQMTSKVSKQQRKTISILAGIVMASSLITYEFSLGMWTISKKAKGIDSVKYVNYNSNYHFNNMGMMTFYNKEIRQMLFDRGASDDQIITYLQKSTLVKDDYTGKLNNPNVFVILIETGDHMMINQYTTQNLWTLFKQNGVISHHNYSYNHTNVSNTISIEGNYPQKELNELEKYNMPFGLPMLLKDKNYNTRCYIDLSADQDGSHDLPFMKTVGFDKIFSHDELLPDIPSWEYSKSNFINDSIVAERIIKDLKQYHQSSTGKIYCQWLTQYMHLTNLPNQYNQENIDKLYSEFGPKLKQLESEGKWKNPCTTEESRQKYEIYTLKTMDFDKGLGMIMDYFYGQENPELNNTLLVAFGDHNWYEWAGKQTMSQIVKKVDDTDNINMYSTMLGLYHPKLTTQIDQDKTGLFIDHELQKMTSHCSIVPSILDLLGIDYNQNIYQGKSIFDLNGNDKYDKSIDDIYYSFALNMYMNENYTSSNGSYITKIIKDDGKQQEFIKKVQEKSYQLRILDAIYHNNFFDRHNYKEFIPKENSFRNQVKEYILAKYY